MPLYPVFVAAATRGTEDFRALLIAQSLVSTGTILCAAMLARQFFGRPAGVVAAALTAIYPYYLWHDTSLQETGLLTFLTAAATVLLVAAGRARAPGTAAAAGLVLGLALLTRPIALPFSVCAGAWLLLPDASSTPLRRRAATAALFAAALCLTVSPWLVRNHAATGRWTFGTENGAAVFYGNNPATFAVYPAGSIDGSAKAARALLTPDERTDLLAQPTELARSDWLERRGRAYIAADPGRFLVNGLRKNLAAFGVLPSPRHDWKTDLIASASYGPVLLLALVAAWRTRRRWRELLPIYAHFAGFAAVTGVLWGHSSHRAYLDVYLIVLAASVLAAAAALPERVATGRAWWS